MVENKNVLEIVFFVLVAILLIVSLANTTKDTYTTKTSNNETLTFTAENTEITDNDDLISVTGLRNITSEDITSFCNITLKTGIIQCNETESNTGYIDYNYYPDNYIKGNSASRILMSLTIILIVMGFVFAIYKNKKY